MHKAQLAQARHGSGSEAGALDVAGVLQTALSRCVQLALG
jgi:hypothetical protein